MLVVYLLCMVADADRKSKKRVGLGGLEEVIKDDLQETRDISKENVLYELINDVRQNILSPEQSKALLPLHQFFVHENIIHDFNENFCIFLRTFHALKTGGNPIGEHEVDFPVNLMNVINPLKEWVSYEEEAVDNDTKDAKEKKRIKKIKDLKNWLDTKFKQCSAIVDLLDRLGIQDGESSVRRVIELSRRMSGIAGINREVERFVVSMPQLLEMFLVISPDVEKILEKEKPPIWAESPEQIA